MKDILAKYAGLRKETAEVLIISAIVVLVGLSAFGLGRLSSLESGRPRLVIHAPDMPAAVAQAAPAYTAPVSVPGPQVPTEKNFVASKNGSKYYSAGCSGASRIKAENQIWFATIEDAKAAGYTPSATCPQLQ